METITDRVEAGNLDRIPLVVKDVLRLILGLSALLAGLLLAAVFLSEGAVHIPANLRVAASPEIASRLAAEYKAGWENASLRTADGATLHGWYFQPDAWNRATVILLHGVADSRLGMMGHAGLLLRHGYAVLAPDARGHGSSGGGLTGYGALEARDVQLWADWNYGRHPPRVLYGWGASMGASVLLQALPLEHRFCAAIAESPFSTFRDVAYHRVGQRLGLSQQAAKWALFALVEPALWYAWARYGIDLRIASPAGALRRVETPVLLIHGSADTNIPILHSRAIYAARPVHTELWEVEGALHTQAMSIAPLEYERRVLHLFRVPSSGREVLRG
ncbi:MAG TPA: alpha/beta fold hydrolase [Bryobacteraceae bacterium]|nr:alpha/beta fold hydrolase [Bryobacteraceae bacterium]